MPLRVKHVSSREDAAAKGGRWGLETKFFVAALQGTTGFSPDHITTMMSMFICMRGWEQKLISREDSQRGNPEAKLI